MPYVLIEDKWREVNSLLAAQLIKDGYTVSYSKNVSSPSITQLVRDTTKAVLVATDRASRDLTQDEARDFAKIRKSMRDNPGLWFTEGTGEYFGLLVPNSTAALNLEQMQGKGGGLFDMSEPLIGAVQEWMFNGIPNPNAISTEGRDPGDTGGGGGGGGRARFVSPDRGTVEDTVRSQLIALVGEGAPQRVNELTDKWLDAYRKSWEIRQTGGQDIDPNQTVLSLIRNQEDYKNIHSLRPDGSDEMTWISTRRNRLNQLGLTPEDADERAIRMAQLGVNLNDIETGQFQNSRGRKDIELFQRLGKAAEMVGRSL